LIYLDSSAPVKLAHLENESLELEGWLHRRRSERRVASALVEVEVSRALISDDRRMLAAAAAQGLSTASPDLQ
jgi:hypothetical protein